VDWFILVLSILGILALTAIFTFLIFSPLEWHRERKLETINPIEIYVCVVCGKTIEYAQKVIYVYKLLDRDYSFCSWKCLYQFTKEKIIETT